MWFEILPSIGVIFCAMTGGLGASYIVNKIGLGRPAVRNPIHQYDCNLMYRDERLSGKDWYTYNGLEAIPDEGTPPPSAESPRPGRPY